MSAQATPAGGVPSAAGQAMAEPPTLPPCRFIAEPDIDPSLIPATATDTREMASAGELAADDWLASLAPQPGPPIIFVTRQPLRTARCRSVFGFADRRARAALISLVGLESEDPVTTRRRLAALAAHELGHLAGYGHCRAPGCVMRPAESAADLDARRLAFCRRCRARRLWPWAAGLLAVCLLLSLSLDTAIEKIRNRTQVFSWRLSGPDAALVFEQEELLRLRNPAEAQAAAEALNALYASMTPPPLRLEAESGRLRIAAGSQTLFPLDWVRTAGAAPEEFARRWIARVNPLIQGKGTVDQGCPSCHVDRRGEVLDAMARRSRWWR